MRENTCDLFDLKGGNILRGNKCPLLPPLKETLFVDYRSHGILGGLPLNFTNYWGTFAPFAPSSYDYASGQLIYQLPVVQLDRLHIWGTCTTLCRSISSSQR